MGLALLLATAATGSAASGVAATSSPATHTFGEIVVGVPDLNLTGAKRAGGVDVYFPDGSKQRVTEQNLGLVGSGKGDFARFGAAAVRAKLNGDQYFDLVVGAPGVRGGGAKGRVVLLFGSATGITSTGAQVLSPGEAGTEFGTALSVGGGSLYVGAPGLDEEKVSNAGGVYRYLIDAQGKATGFGLLTESFTYLGGTLQTNQRFGEVLAPASDGVIIGLPNKNVGSAIGAGEMIRFHATPIASEFTAEIWTQNSPGVPGTAETGDHFGAALAKGGYAVGVPGEDLGTIIDAGTVQTFRRDPTRPTYLSPSTVVSQADQTVPGGAEAGDRFGAALTSGIFNCQETTTMAIGSPGEDVGMATSAGTVTFVGLPISPGDPTCAAKRIHQGQGLQGSPEDGDAVGTSLARIAGNPDLDEDTFDTLLIGIPGEDIGTTPAHRNTGRASIWNNYTTPFTQGFGYQGGDLPGLRYGAVFAAEAG
jgi:hypothetical protein